MFTKEAGKTILQLLITEKQRSKTELLITFSPFNITVFLSYNCANNVDADKFERPPICLLATFSLPFLSSLVKLPNVSLNPIPTFKLKKNG